MTLTTTLFLQARLQTVFYLSADTGTARESTTPFFKWQFARHLSIAEWNSNSTLILLFLRLGKALQARLSNDESHACNGEIARSI